MAIEYGMDLANEWGYLYCTLCEDVSLVKLMDIEELDKEKEAFKEEHKHDSI